MVLNKDLTATKDQIIRNDTQRNILITEYFEKIGIEEGPTHRFNIDPGTMFIFNHATNGEMNNSSLSLGSGGLGSTTLEEVTSPNNIFHWHFREEDSSIGANGEFDTVSITDTGSSTATEDISNKQIFMFPGQIWQSRPLYLDSSSTKILTEITPILTYGTGSTNIEFSTDDFVTSTAIENGATTTITSTTANQLKLRATAVAGAVTSIKDVKVGYKLGD